MELKEAEKKIRIVVALFLVWIFVGIILRTYVNNFMYWSYLVGTILAIIFFVIYFFKQKPKIYKPKYQDAEWKEIPARKEQLR